jgi:hypothetical protein
MGGSGGGGTTVQTTYQQPKDPYGDALKKYQLEQLKKADADAAAAAKKKAEKEAADLAAATAAFDPYKQTIQKQLGSGLLSYTEAQAQLKDYVSQYKLSPQTEALQDLTDYYLTDVQPGQQKGQIEAAYKQYLGKGPTAEQLSEAQAGFSTGYYKSVGDLQDALKMSDEYQEKFNKSYLDNYYETMFGKAKKDDTGKKTYDFKFNKSLMPTYAGDLATETGVSLPEFQESFTGTAGEIEANLDAIKETKKYIYSAGLTNLQGNIDKETQKLKNEGAKEVAKITKEGGIYTSLIGAFSF